MCSTFMPVFAQTHDCAFAEVLFDLPERLCKRFLFIRSRCDRL